jgi:thiaminase
MSDREFRSVLLKVINDIKEDSNKQINEVKKTIQDLDKKGNNMEEKFSKEMEITKEKQVEILEMKTSISQTRHRVHRSRRKKNISDGRQD